MSLPSIDVAALATVTGGASVRYVRYRTAPAAPAPAPATSGLMISFNGQPVDLNGPLPAGMSIDQSNGALNITFDKSAGSQQAASSTQQAAGAQASSDDA